MAAWAMIIAVGVKSSRRSPSGPERQRRMLTIRPTLTGGSPIPVWTSPTSKRATRKAGQGQGRPDGDPEQQTDEGGAERDP